MIFFKIERTFIDSVQEHIVSITIVSSKIRQLSYILSNLMPSVLKAGYSLINVCRWKDCPK